jgi:hypothetical protein
MARERERKVLADKHDDEDIEKDKALLDQEEAIARDKAEELLRSLRCQLAQAGACPGFKYDDEDIEKDKAGSRWSRG